MTGIYTKSKYLLLLFISGCLVYGCGKKDSGTAPTYVHIDSFAFNPTGAFPADVSFTHQINSVWAYYNNTPIGVFDLPANIPVITNGNGVVTLRPGIAVSGLNDFLAPYPFYTSDTFTLTPNPGGTVTHVPVTKYFSSTNFKVLSTFDFRTNFRAVDGTVEMSLNSGNGMITLTAPRDTLAEDSSTVPFSIPLNKDAYLELNYKNTVPFYVGLRANLGTIFTKYYLAGLYPTDHWQKFYLSVKDFEAQYQATSYTLYIKSSLPAGESGGTVLLDNIQFVYFD